ncbi:hypothetical protein [Spirosoma endbachense]|uniref:Uncharacterized protein n=1 Tax=Spirosoma endbachense TaxID=2666025 RepID=A0A6P1WAF7_9BACT|nr:hypothetical protein [Spirosoma endbachense]QHW01038.1 hypothetical protein GJR95_41075 [Spirosoma endbachense]
MGLSIVGGCTPPYKPDYDSGFGQLIYVNKCNQQLVYLVDLAGFHTYQSGLTYSDTLTLHGTKYTHVIRLDSSQATFLSKRSALDKVSIDFRPLARQALPSCAVVPRASIQTVQVLSIGNTDYQ